METSRKTTVVFDVGRVLIEWDVYALYRKLLPDDQTIADFLDEVGLIAVNVELDRGTMGFSEGIAKLCAKYPHHADLIRAFDERWPETVPGPIQNSVDVLGRLKVAGVPLYAITNFSAEKWALTCERFSFLEDSFIDTVVSGREKRIKPESAIFELFLKRNGLFAGDCVCIDDSEANIAAANALGIDGILFTPETDLETELNQRGLRI